MGIDNSTKPTSRRNYLRLAGATGIAGLAGCTDITGGGSGTPDAITLSGTMPLTGALAATGEAIHTGYQAAVQKINEDGGVPIGDDEVELELDITDDASDPDRATTQYQQFLNEDDVDFFLGSFSSGIILATASIVANNDKVMVQSGGGSDDIFTQGWDEVFGIYPRASRQMQVSVNYFDSLDPEVETFSVITENDAYNSNLSEGVRGLLDEAGIEVINNHEVPDNVNDVSSVVSSINDEDPDGLFVASHGGTGQLVAEEVSTREVDLDIFYEVLGPWQPTYLDSVGEAGNYVNTITYFLPGMEVEGGPVFESSQAFADYTQENVSETPVPFNHQIASGAAAIVAYYQAFSNAGEVSVDAVRSELSDLSMNSFYGEIEFTEDGDGHPLKMGPMVAQIQDQNYEVIYPEDVASADPAYPIPPWSER